MMMETRAFADLPGKVTTHGWELPHRMTYEEWRLVGLRVNQIREWTNFALGDWLETGFHLFGESFAQAASELNVNEERQRQLKWVASRVSPVLRNTSLTWSHHYAISHLEPSGQQEWLDRAAESRWSVRELREALTLANLLHKRIKAKEPEEQPLVLGEPGGLVEPENSTLQVDGVEFKVKRRPETVTLDGVLMVPTPDGEMCSSCGELVSVSAPRLCGACYGEYESMRAGLDADKKEGEV